MSIYDYLYTKLAKMRQIRVAYPHGCHRILFKIARTPLKQSPKNGVEKETMKILLRYYVITSMIFLVLASFILDGFWLFYYFLVFDMVAFLFLIYLRKKIEIRWMEKFGGIVIPLIIFICCVVFENYFH